MAGHFAGVFHDRASSGSRPSCRLAHTHTGGHCGVLFSEQPPHDRAVCPSSGHLAQSAQEAILLATTLVVTAIRLRQWPAAFSEQCHRTP